MKKILSFILTASILLSIVFCFALSAEAAKSVYSKVIATRYNESSRRYDFEVNESKAFFYDFDGNGAKELMVIEYREIKSAFFSHNMYLYTGKNGKVVTLVKGLQLGVDAGQGVSAKQGIAVNKKSGKKYAYIEWNYGGGSDSSARFYTCRYYYTIKGAKVTNIHRAVIQSQGTDSGGLVNTYYVNGVKKSKAAFNNWINAYKYTIKNDTLKSVYTKTR